MLINPRVKTQTDIAWICDDCGTMLNEHPVSHMPRIIGIYKGWKNLVVIEEYIDGKTIADILEAGVIKKKEAVRIARDL